MHAWQVMQEGGRGLGMPVASVTKCEGSNARSACAPRFFLVKTGNCMRSRCEPTQYDFHRFFTHVYFFKLVGCWRKNFFGQSEFFPKIPKFCRIGLPPAKTFWMIMSPQKRVKKSQQFVPAKHSYIM